MKNSIKVSIIVPIYNVEEYLDECLASLKKQTLKEIEVLMINDGSTDHSDEIAKRYEAENDHFRYFYKENGGLGNTRNFAIPYVTGEYLTFMDSDDIIPEEAYEKMYELARKTGNDLVIGNVKRFNSLSFSDSAMHKKVFDEDFERTDIYKTPKLVYDTISCNKLFKTTFYRENNFMFPEKILYEDIPVTVPAYFKANGVSVLTDVCYLWRIRDGVSKSITQNRTDLKNFTDRIKVLDMVKKFYDENVTDKHSLLMRDYKWLDVDLKIYINQFLEADDYYREVAIKEIKRYFQYISDDAFKMLRAIDRMKYYYINNDDIESLLKLLQYQKTYYKSISIKKRNKQYIGDFPINNVPESLKVMTQDLEYYPLKQAVTNIYFEEKGLIIDAYFYITRLSKQNDFNARAYLYSRKSDKKVPIYIERKESRFLTSKHGYRFCRKPLKIVKYDYSQSAYQLSIDFNNSDVIELLQEQALIMIEYQNEIVHKEFFLGDSDGYSLNLIQSNVFDDGVVYTHLINDGNLQIGFDNDIVFINDVFVKDNKVCVRSDHSLLLEQKGIFKTFSKEEEYQTLDLKDISRGIGYIFQNDRKNKKCVYTDDKSHYYYNDGNLLLIENTKYGNLGISLNNSQSFIQSIEFVDKTLMLKIKNYTEFKNNDPKLVLENKKYNYQISFAPMKRSAEGFEEVLTFSISFTDEKIVQDIAAGNYLFYLQDKPSTVYSLSIATQIIETKIKHAKSEFKFEVLENNLFMNVKHAWKTFENSKTKRRLIKKYAYRLFRHLPLSKHSIVFEGWWGDKYHCNPKAIYEYINQYLPEYRCIWLLNDDYIPIKGNAKRVRRNSLAYYYYLARAKYFVNNVNFHDNFEKRDNQIEVQTMHGTPLKTMGLDVPGELDDPIVREKFIKKCDRWDYLVVQSQKAADITASCFAFRKNFLKTGYPRNDVLFSKNNEKDIAILKDKMGIPINKKVIMYAPTWRKRNYFEMNLDLEDMKKAFGEKYILILRVHPFAYPGFDERILNDFVYNFSTYPSVEELYLVSDLVITDYSSVMFDYTVLNRPILFFTYDLTQYRDFLRGFTFNFEKEAPGPLLETYEDLRESIINIDEVSKQYSHSLDNFKKKFNEFESGEAAKRIVETVLKK